MKRVLIVTSTFERAHFFPDGFDEWMVGVTGVEIAAERPLDGVNLIPYLTGERDEAPHEYLFWEMIRSGDAAVRHGDDKLKVAYKTDTTELFDLGEDLGETTDLATAERRKAERLRKELRQWTQQLKPCLLYTSPSPRDS